MLTAKLFDKSVISASAANSSLCADLCGNELKDSFCIIIKSSYDLWIYLKFNTKICKIGLKLSEVLITFFAEIIRDNRCIFGDSLTNRALAVKKPHGILCETLLAGITDFFLVRLKISSECFVVLGTAGRTTDGIYIQFDIFQTWWNSRSLPACGRSCRKQDSK